MFEDSYHRSNILSERSELIDLIDRLLIDILNETKSIEKGSSVFHCKEAPTISISMYLKSKQFLNFRNRQVRELLEISLYCGPYLHR